MNCKKCGNEIAEGELTCSQCGEPVSREDDVTQTFSNNSDVEAKQDTFFETVEKSDETSESDNISFDDSLNNFSEDTSVTDFSEDDITNDINPEANNKSTIKTLFLSVVGVLIVGVIVMIVVNIYNNSPRKIFERIKESESYNKFIAQKGYTIKSYSFVDILKADGENKKEVLLEAEVSEEGVTGKIFFIACEDKEINDYKIGLFVGVGGQFVENIDLYKNTDGSKGIFAIQKKSDKISDELLEKLKSLGQSQEDIESMLSDAYGIGSEDYIVFNEEDFTLVNYSAKNSESKGGDFVYVLSPNKEIVKSINTKKQETTYKYTDSEDEAAQNPANALTGIPEDTSKTIAEDEFNKYYDEFINGKELIEKFEVSVEEQQVEEKENSDTQETSVEEETQVLA